MDLQQLIGSSVNAATPFRIWTLLIFVAAITHTLLAQHFTSLSKKVAAHHRKEVSFWAEVLYFLGEVEVVFALWVIPLVIVVLAFYGWNELIEYLNSRVYRTIFYCGRDEFGVNPSHHQTR